MHLKQDDSFIEIRRNDVIKNYLKKLLPKEKLFVSEYVKDFAPRRAAEAAGYRPENGVKLLDKNKILNAIDNIVAYAAENTGIDAEWILQQLSDNHRIARQQGNLGASNTALKLMMQHQHVDAMATQRTEIGVVPLEDQVSRIQRGRNRLAEAKQVGPALIAEKVESFL